MDPGVVLDEDGRMRSTLLLLAFLGASVNASAAPSIGMLWKARALEAMDRLEAKPAATEPNSPERFEEVLEFVAMLPDGWTVLFTPDTANDGPAPAKATPKASVKTKPPAKRPQQVRQE